MISWCAATLYADLIFILSGMERMVLPLELKYHSDKLVHGVEYSILGWLLARALHLSFRFRSLKRLIGVAALLSGLYGLSDEYHQSFVPGRESSPADLAADTAGAWAGAWLWAGAMRKKRTLEDPGGG